jgi:hypothetical protein
MRVRKKEVSAGTNETGKRETVQINAQKRKYPKAKGGHEEKNVIFNGS